MSGFVSAVSIIITNRFDFKMLKVRRIFAVVSSSLGNISGIYLNC